MKIVRDSYPKAGIAKLCNLLGKTRHAFYDAQWRTEQQAIEHAVILELVGEIKKNLPRIGTEKLYYLLQPKFLAHGIKLGRDGLHQLLIEQGLAIRKRKKKPKTTNSKHWMKKYPNLVKEWVPFSPDMLWVCDITYLTLKDGFCYLSLIMDAYSRKLTGHCLSLTLNNEGCIMALEMALKGRQYYHHQLIHHSDRGSQYCSKDYVFILTDNRILISMTENGDPYQNAKAERVNGILKEEFGLDAVFETYEQALQAVEDAICKYNEIRPHASIDYLTPVQAHRLSGHIRQRWKSRPVNVFNPVADKKLIDTIDTK